MEEPDWRRLALRLGPYVVVAVVFGFMLWVRLMPMDRVVQPNRVLFSGNDPWYHARIVRLTVNSYPATPDFDPWSYFPYGTGRHSGFGGLFDQLIALAALVVGFGSPSDHLIDTVTAVAPAVFGALTVVPVYVIARQLSDRWSALLSVGLLAVVGGQFISRTVVGVSDHQSAEAFFGAIAVAGFIYAVERSRREKPTLADLQDRNWTFLRAPALAGVIGGIAIASYLSMWPQGVMIVFTLGVATVIQLVRDHLNDTSTEYLTFGVAVTMITAGVLTLLNAETYTIEASAFSLLQPLVTFGIGVGVIVLFALSEETQSRGYEKRQYPVFTAALIIAGFVAAAVVFPKSIDLFSGLIKRVYSFGLLRTSTALTVAEIAPATPDDAWNAYGGLFPLAIAGLLVMAARVIRQDRPVELIVVLWSLNIFSAYFSMVRFGYYMGVTVAILSGFVIWWTAKVANFDAIKDPSDLETYQVIVILIVLVTIIPGNVVAVSGTSPPVWESADRFGGTNSAWQSELRWVRDNTPPIPLEYEGRFDPPEDGDFDYPDGAYGVMSWWDYGHWITFTGHRIPDANPFQQGPRPASAYLLAQNETRANLLVEALPAYEQRNDLQHMSSAELREVIEDLTAQQASEDTRYVMIDDQMAAGKFSAIATWTGPGPGTYFSRQEFQVGNTRAQLIGTNDRYRNTMLARLYLQDARGLSHYRLVHESGDSAIVSVARQTAQGFESTNFIHRRLTSQVFAAVEQRQDLFFYNVHQPARVKTFERVPGATLTGRVNTTNATTVFATVQLQTNRNRNFTYVQSVQTDSSGRFEMTVPYATTNTVEPADGGTDSGVEALGNYQLFAGNPFQPTARGQTPVPEPAIYDGATIQVEMVSVERPSGNETEGSNNSALSGPPLPEPSANLDTRNPALGSGGTHPLSAAPRRAVDG